MVDSEPRHIPGVCSVLQQSSTGNHGERLHLSVWHLPGYFVSVCRGRARPGGLVFAKRLGLH